MKVLRFFYPKDKKIDKIEDINKAVIKLANDLVFKAAEIDKVVDVVGNFAPGIRLKPTARQIVSRLRRHGLRNGRDNFGNDLTLSERLESLGGAAREGTIYANA